MSTVALNPFRAPLERGRELEPRWRLTWKQLPLAAILILGIIIGLALDVYFGAKFIHQWIETGSAF